MELIRMTAGVEQTNKAPAIPLRETQTLSFK